MRELPVRSGVVARVPVRVLHQVVLVLGLGLPERPHGLDLGDDVAWPKPRRVDVSDGLERDALLLVVRVKDRRTVARADVIALTIACRRVVYLEEELENVAVRGHGRIEDDFDRLCVRSVVAVGGVWHVATGVPDSRRDHARLPADEVLYAPETAARKDCPLRRLSHCHFSIRQRYYVPLTQPSLTAERSRDPLARSGEQRRVQWRSAAAASCASTTAIAAMLTMSVTSAPLLSTCTGLAMPTRIGPIATARPRCCNSLYATFAASRLGKTRTFASPVRVENG